MCVTVGIAGLSLFSVHRLIDDLARTGSRRAVDEQTNLLALNATIADVNRHAGETGAASAEMLASAQSLAREGPRLKSRQRMAGQAP